MTLFCKKFSKSRGLPIFTLPLDSENFLQKSVNLVQGGPERSMQSNLAVFIVEGGLYSKFPYTFRIIEIQWIFTIYKK